MNPVHNKLLEIAGDLLYAAQHEFEGNDLRTTIECLEAQQSMLRSMYNVLMKPQEVANG